jgi:hypothetical protein
MVALLSMMMLTAPKRLLLLSVIGESRPAAGATQVAMKLY